MESIEQMIKRLCPKGVEYVKLGEVCDVGTGSGNRQDATEDGKYPFFVRSKEILLNEKYEFDEEAILIPGEGGIGDIFHYYKGKYALHQRTYRIHPTSDKINAKFLYYYMFANFKKFILMKAVSATVTSIRKPMIENFLIPLPPLEIQSRIVEVLDKMTTLTAELEAELEARKQQYEYYRNKLLTFSEIGGGNRQVTWKTLGETCTILTGGEPCGNIIKGGKSDSMHPYAIFGNGAEIYGWSDTYRVGTDAVTISSIGANTGTIYYRKGPFTPIIRLKVILPGENVSQRFLYHILKTIKIKKKKSSVPNMNANEIKSILIPVPSMEEQSRIVSILDRFEALTTDLQSGLPAEIEARRQQYEYYRNKLLTFEAV